MNRRASILLMLGVAAFGCLAAYFTVAVESRGGIVRAVRADRWVSPNVPENPAAISFELRDGGRPTVHLLRGDAAVRVLEPVGTAHVAAGAVAMFDWDGRDDDGAPVADGSYRLGIDLGGDLIRLPTRILVDSVPPAVRCVGRDVRVPERGVLRIHAEANEPVRWRFEQPGGEVVHVVERAGRLRDERFPGCGPPIILAKAERPFGALTLIALDRARNATTVSVPPDGIVR